MGFDSLHYEESGETLGLREFFHIYRDALPQLLIVKEGFYSCSDMETLSRDQVIFVPTFLTRSRVLAMETGEKHRTFSLPKTFPVQFRLSQTSGSGGKRSSSPQSLDSIVDQHKLPVEAEMMTSSVLHSVSGPDGNEVSLFAGVRLTHLYSEVFLVGYTIDAQKDGCRIYHQPFSVPLYLNHVTVTRVVGSKGMTQSQWSRLLQQFASRVEGLQGKADLTSPDLIIYSKNTQPLPKSPGHGIKRKENLYETLVPASVVNLLTRQQTLSQHGASPRKSVANEARQIFMQERKDRDQNTHYEILRPPSRGPVYESIMPPPRASTGNVGGHPPPDYFTPLASASPPGRIPSSPVQHQGSSVHHQGPPLPPLHPSRTRVAPPSQDAMAVRRESHVDLRSPVKSLTISEVCEKLRLLNLERHEEAFRKQMVDGAVLSRMQMEDLKSDFSMTSAEAIRLMLYVTEGHVPK